jgi:hypothetical protein
VLVPGPERGDVDWQDAVGGGGKLAIGVAGKRDDRMPEGARLQRCLGSAAYFPGERDCQHCACGRQVADRIAGEVQRMHGMNAQPAVAPERERGGEPGEGRVAAPGQVQMLDVAPGEPLGQVPYVTAMIGQLAGDDIGDGGDLAAHDVNAVVDVRWRCRIGCHPADDSRGSR